MRILLCENVHFLVGRVLTEKNIDMDPWTFSVEHFKEKLNKYIISK